MLLQLNMHSTADQLLEQYTITGECAWRSLAQRPPSFAPALLGVPYPLEPVEDGGGGMVAPPTALALEASYKAIKKEFDALVARSSHRCLVGCGVLL
jgi:hypothetical protein